MADNLPEAVTQAARAVRGELDGVDDQTFSRAIAVVDNAIDPSVNQVLLDPLRGRLARLKPARPLRLSRLLFIPLDPLIVPARSWRPGQPCVPRTVLDSMAKAVTTGLGNDARYIDDIVADKSLPAAQIISRAGDLLWPAAAGILLRAQPPPTWAQTGLPPRVFAPLARSIATVLRRAPQLHRLARDEDVAVLRPDEATIRAIVHDLAREPEEGAVMVMQLVLLRAPQAGPTLIRQLAGSGEEPRARAIEQALARAAELSVAALLQDACLAKQIKDAPLQEAAKQARRVGELLRFVEQDLAAGALQSCTKQIRDTLNQACLSSLGAGVQASLTAHLGAGAIGADAQMRMEQAARELANFAMVGRRLGSPASYGEILCGACGAVREAAAAGTLNAVQACRLLDTLAGPEIAASFYQQMLPVAEPVQTGPPSVRAP